MKAFTKTGQVGTEKQFYWYDQSRELRSKMSGIKAVSVKPFFTSPDQHAEFRHCQHDLIKRRPELQICDRCLYGPIFFQFLLKV